jgi:nitroimidazol reductase NimA-like FMN-containing flavoprotein (pyridoxamine 5'-phosphate oxidase superfamily)
VDWSKAEKEFIATARVVRIATVGADGVPHNVPVCPLLDRDRIYFGSEAEGKKVRNIRANPVVTLVFDDYTEDWAHLRGVMIQGRARIVNRQEFRTLRKRIYAKYLQYESSAALAEKEAAIVEITPERKFSWGFQT